MLNLPINSSLKVDSNKKLGVSLPDYYADSPQAWFCSIDATFATSRVTRSLTKFNWALSKLPFALIDSIGRCAKPLRLHRPVPGAAGHSAMLLRSLRRREDGKWLDHPDLGNNRPSVLWDQLNAPHQATVKEIQTVLFLRELPRYIRDLINSREFQDPETLTQRCNKIWEDWTRRRAPLPMGQPPPQPFQGPTPSSGVTAAPPLLFAGRAPASAAHQPLARPGATAAIAGVSTTPVSDPRP
jgi:hypothetical protein